MKQPSALLLERIIVVSCAAALMLLCAAWVASAATAPTSVDEAGGPQFRAMAFLELERWSPYAVGAGLGVLSWLAFLLSGHSLGASGSYAQTAAMAERLVRGGKAPDRPYYRKTPPSIGWGWMLLVGVVLGAALSAWLSGSFAWNFLPAMWAERFGDQPALRWVMAFAGGLLLGFGSRWAGGCTSGHGISGALQLTASSWLAAVCFFIGGVGTAFLLY